LREVADDSNEQLLVRGRIELEEVIVDALERVPERAA
jgi:hypothetical protein